MRCRVTLIVSGKKFYEEMEAADYEAAKRVALARNPGAKVLGCTAIYEPPKVVSGGRHSPNRGVKTTSASSSFSSGLGLIVVIVIGYGIVEGLDKVKPFFEGLKIAPGSNSSAPARSSQSASPPKSYWGAFSVSDSTGRTGWAKGYESKDAADAAANRSCNRDDCRVIATFGRGYATLVESDLSWWFHSGKDTKEDAESVLERCIAKTPDANCRIIDSISF